MATVLKPSTPHANIPPAASGIAEFNFEDLSLEARRQMERCRDEIARMQQAAKAELEALRAQARAEGLREGRGEAAREAAAKIQSGIEARLGEQTAAVQSMGKQIAELHDGWMKQYADTLVGMVIAVSEKVVRSRLEREPEILLRWTNEALAAARSANRLTIALHPETLGRLGSAIDELLNQPGLPEETSIVPDESVPPAGAVVRQVGGEVVATLERQLACIEEVLKSH